jgi:hypothetical protein
LMQWFVYYVTALTTSRQILWIPYLFYSNKNM